MTTDKNRLLRAIGDIDDKYITEIIAEDAAGKKTAAKKPVIRYFMYYVPAAAALLIAIVCIKAAMVSKDSAPGASNDSAAAPAAAQCEEASEEMETDGSLFESLNIQGILPANEAPTANSAEAAGDAGDVASTDDMADIGMPNPFIDCETLEDAAVIAGFEFNIPDDLESGCTRIIRAMEGKMIEVIFINDEGEEIYRLRKGTITHLSGDYNDYSFAISVDSSLYGGTLSGKEEGSTSCAEWSNDEFYYSLTTGDTALDTDTVEHIIETIMTAEK